MLGKTNLVCSILGCWTAVHLGKSMRQWACQMVRVGHHIVSLAGMDWQTDMGSGSVLECRPFLEDNHGQGDIQALGQLQLAMYKKHPHLLLTVECMHMSPCGFSQNILHLEHTCYHCRALCIFGSSDHTAPYPGSQSQVCSQQEDKKHMDFLAAHVDRYI